MSTALNTADTGDDWEPASFNIATVHGPQRVGGIVRQHFGIHLADPARWVLTHLPTGAMLGCGETQSAPICAVGRIKGLLDWSFSDRSGMLRQDHTPVLTALLECGMAVPDDGRPTWGEFAGQPIAGRA